MTAERRGIQEKITGRRSTKRPEEDKVPEYVFARALYPSVKLARSALSECCGNEGFNDSRSCVDLRPLKHIECALYVCKSGQPLLARSLAPFGPQSSRHEVRPGWRVRRVRKSKITTFSFRKIKVKVERWPALTSTSAPRVQWLRRRNTFPWPLKLG